MLAERHPTMLELRTIMLGDTTHASSIFEPLDMLGGNLDKQAEYWGPNAPNSTCCVANDVALLVHLCIPNMLLTLLALVSLSTVYTPTIFGRLSMLLHICMGLGPNLLFTYLDLFGAIRIQ